MSVLAFVYIVLYIILYIWCMFFGFIDSAVEEVKSRFTSAGKRPAASTVSVANVSMSLKHFFMLTCVCLMLLKVSMNGILDISTKLNRA